MYARANFSPPLAEFFRKYRIGLFTNSANPELLALSSSLYREVCAPIVVPGTNAWGRGYYGYACFNHVLSSRRYARRFDYLVYVDEDCFLTDLGALQELLEYFIANDFGFCGMPDGGMCHIRRHNPVVINTFFAIYNLRAIRAVYDRGRVRHAVFDESFKRFVSPVCTGEQPNPFRRVQEPVALAYDDYEPYYRIFYHLLAAGLKPLYLVGCESLLDPEGITTELFTPGGAPFCVHTWYAREYGRDPQHTERIKNVYDRVREGIKN